MLRTSADEDPTNVRTGCHVTGTEMAKQREASDNSGTAMRETVMEENSNNEKREVTGGSQRG